ncbi:unnamed protein product [Prunus armeniaca]
MLPKPTGPSSKRTLLHKTFTLAEPIPRESEAHPCRKVAHNSQSKDGLTKTPTYVFTRFVITPVVEGQSSPLPCEPLTSQQEVSEWAELRLLQSVRAEVAVLEDFSGLETAL